jgi:hypothetical protein
MVVLTSKSSLQLPAQKGVGFWSHGDSGATFLDGKTIGKATTWGVSGVKF